MVHAAVPAEDDSAAAVAESEQQDERQDSGATAEPLTHNLEAALRHARTGSTSFLLPPELAALTAFLKVDSCSSSTS